MPAAAIVGAAVVGAGATLIAGSKAAKAQKQAATQQIDYAERRDEQTRADYAPWREAGSRALSILDRTYGTNGQPGDRSAFETSPGYEFRRDEGLRATDRSFASRGLLNSGAADKARMRYGEGLAASEYGDWWNRTAGLAGVGQAATNSTTQAGMGYAGMANNAIGQAGAARASSYANTGSAINSGINNVLSAYLYSRNGGFGGGGKCQIHTA